MISTGNKLHLTIAVDECGKLGTLTTRISLNLVHHISDEAAVG